MVLTPSAANNQTVMGTLATLLLSERPQSALKSIASSLETALAILLGPSRDSVTDLARAAAKTRLVELVVTHAFHGLSVVKVNALQHRL